MTTLQGKEKGTFPRFPRSLSPGEVKAIRIQFEREGWRVRDIVKKYGVSKKAISRLLKGQTYKDIL